MRLLSLGCAGLLSAVVAAATEVNAQGVAPLTNYGPESGFFTPQAPKDLERGILEARKSMVPQAMPATPELPPLAPQPAGVQPLAASAAPAVVAAMPAAAPVAPAPAPFVRIPDPTQGGALGVNAHPLAQAAQGRAADTSRTEEQMDRVERENERARQAVLAPGVGAAFDGLTSERNR